MSAATEQLARDNRAALLAAIPPDGLWRSCTDIWRLHGTWSRHAVDTMLADLVKAGSLQRQRVLIPTGGFKWTYRVREAVPAA